MAKARTRRCCQCCSGGGATAAALVTLLLVSAVPMAAIVALERTKSATQSYEYRSLGWLRECGKWDPRGNRFLVSTFLGGGVSEIPAGGGNDVVVLEEREVVRDADVAGNASLGIMVDPVRGRLMVTYADVLGHRFGALAAYDLATWRRLFLTRLTGPEDEPSFADDVAVDADGNAYVTDAKSNKLWKVGPNGELLSVMRNPVFTPESKAWYKNFVGLNGIVFHPDGYLLVIHTSAGCLFKVAAVDTAAAEVTVVAVAGGSLVMGDGLELLSPTTLVVAGTPSARLVESSDGWKTARVAGRYVGPMHRVATSATVKDGRVYLSHLIGGPTLLGKRTHVIAEAVF